MTDRPPYIDTSTAAIVGRHVVVPPKAAVAINMLLPDDWRQRLINRGAAPDTVRQVVQTVVALQTATQWLTAEHDQASASGSAETGGNGPRASSWLTTTEAAKVLDLTARQVRNLTADFDAVKDDAGRWRFDRASVYAERRRRDVS